MSFFFVKRQETFGQNAFTWQKRQHVVDEGCYFFFLLFNSIPNDLLFIERQNKLVTESNVYLSSDRYVVFPNKRQ